LYVKYYTVKKENPQSPPEQGHHDLSSNVVDGNVVDGKKEEMELMKKSRKRKLFLILIPISIVLCILVVLALVLLVGKKGLQTQSATEFKHEKTVWLLMPYVGEYWWNTIVEYMEIAVERDGWQFNYDSADGSDETQSEQIITYAQQADILFVFPTSSTGVTDAIRRAEEEFHTPVVSFKGYITGKSRFSLIFDDKGAGETMAKEAVQWLQDKYGTTEGKTVITVNGDLKQSGWRLRQEGFDWIKANHPEINYISVTGGLTPEGWAKVIDSALAKAGDNVDAILSGSDGPYLLGTINALAKYGKLYYIEDPNHVFVASIDGKPSTLSWLRMGYVDTVYSQVPDAISFSAWDVAKKYILKDASYQYSPYKIPAIPVPLQIAQPKGSYWGGKDVVATIEAFDYSETPIGRTPFPIVNKDNVNTWDLYGNSIVKVLGEDIDPLPTFKAKGTEPAWSKNLIDEYGAWKKNQ